MTAPVTSHTNQIQALMNKFGSDQSKLRSNSAYYEANYRPKAVGMAVPAAMKRLLAKIGWGRTYLGNLEERLDIEGFRLAGESNADEKLWQWWQANQMDVQSGLAHTEALIHGRAYITISQPNPNDPLNDPLRDPTSPIIKVESPLTMYAELNALTGRVNRAIRVYEEQDINGRNVQHVTLYLPNGTFGYVESNVSNGWTLEFKVEHNMGIVPVVCILNKERVDQQFGISEIKPELRSLIDAASRLLMNLQAAAELMAVPQRVLFGLAEDEIANLQGQAQFEAYMANILAFEDSNGKIAQFAAAELRNYTEGMDVLRKEAGVVTGLPPQYFTFSTDNPASAEAIQSSENRLVKKAERKCRIFGEAWEDVMRIAYKVMEDSIPKSAFRMEVIWRNPATPTFASMADGVVKLATAATPDGRSILPVEYARIKMGWSQEERDEMERFDKNNSKSRLADLYGQAALANQTRTNPTPQPRGGNE